MVFDRVRGNAEVPRRSSSLDQWRDRQPQTAEAEREPYRRRRGHDDERLPEGGLELLMNWEKRLCHPAVGQIAVDSEVLALQNRTDVLLVFTAAPDSDDAERLAFLSAFVRKKGPTR